MKNKIVFIIKIFIIYALLGSVGIFIALIISALLLDLINGRVFNFESLFGWAAKKAYLGGPASAICVIVFICVSRFFDNELED